MADKPNILLIQTDQHNPHIAGYAGDSIVRTANLDGLAEDGTSFDAAYCQTPLCSPSRLSLLTGCWVSNCGGWSNGAVRDPNQETIPSWLSKQGYTTATVGKMHIAGGDQTHGYQHRPYGDLVPCNYPAHQPDPPGSWKDGHWNNHAVGRFPFAGSMEIPESLTMDQVVTTESLAWLLEFADASPGSPWFFHASYSRPHFPLTAPGRYVRRYLDSELKAPPLPPGFPDGLHPHDRFTVDDFNLLKFSHEEHRRAVACYYACVDYVDDCIGGLIDGLRREGRLDNTYIVYTSDHGDMAGEHGLWWKRSYYEASARVPLLVTGPGITRRCDSSPVELVDLFPTFCDWAGVDAPEGLDGESLKSLLEGQPEGRGKAYARSEMLGPSESTQFRMVRDERWKYAEFPDSAPRLFDLVNDPEEVNDLAGAPPPDAPIDKLKAEIGRSGTWEEINQRREADLAALQKSKDPPIRGAVQYRLSDGRVIDGDGALYIE